MYNNRSFHGKKNHGRSNNNYRKPRQGGRGKQYINPARFVNKEIKTAEAMAYTPEHMFADFNFQPNLQANLDQAGFKQPSAIQDKAIPFALEGRDVIGIANTGTGKTAAFVLPILNKLHKQPKPQSVLIMAPTRELAQQIDVELKKFANGMRLYSAVCVGGMNIGNQIRQIRRNPHVIIGTPGRLKDLFERNVLRPNGMTTLVLDEVDRMLDMGFVHDIRAIASLLPQEHRQTLCFSATLSDSVKSLINDFTQNPELVSVKVAETSEHIYQDIIEFRDDSHKKTLLLEMLKDQEYEKVIVFGETKHGVQRLSETLIMNNISSSAIHGNKTQGQRMKALTAFHTNQSRVLVATDVAARGLDIPSVSHVINFDQPQSYDDYVHRIGRTGRGGKSGTALTFVKI